MFKKLLVAYDGSEDSQKALEMALELSQRFDSEVHLLTIIEQLPPVCGYHRRGGGGPGGDHQGH